MRERGRVSDCECECVCMSALLVDQRILGVNFSASICPGLASICPGLPISIGFCDAISEKFEVIRATYFLLVFLLFLFLLLLFRKHAVGCSVW